MEDNIWKMETYNDVMLVSLFSVLVVYNKKPIIRVCDLGVIRPTYNRRE